MIKLILLKQAGWLQAGWGESQKVFAIVTLAKCNFSGDFLSHSLSLACKTRGCSFGGVLQTRAFKTEPKCPGKQWETHRTDSQNVRGWKGPLEII